MWLEGSELSLVLLNLPRTSHTTHTGFGDVMLSVRWWQWWQSACTRVCVVTHIQQKKWIRGHKEGIPTWCQDSRFQRFCHASCYMTVKCQCGKTQRDCACKECTINKGGVKKENLKGGKLNISFKNTQKQQVQKITKVASTAKGVWSVAMQYYTTLYCTIQYTNTI